MEGTLLVRKLKEIGCCVCEREPLSAHTTFRIGGEATALVTAETAEQVIAVKRLCSETETPLLVIGNGSNLLVSDDGFDGVVLRLAARETVIDGCLVRAAAGSSLTKLCNDVCGAGLSGLEFAFGIPGTVGGAVFMNAGAYGGQLSDVLRRVTAVTPTGDVVTMEAEELALGYRHSVFMENGCIVLEAELELKTGDPCSIRAAMTDYLTRRRDKQPLEYPSAGSFFKRPEGHFAGALIEQCGLKGFTVGGAAVSEKHAGFVINLGGATCADVLALGEAVSKTVKERFGVELEREVQLIGG